MAQVSIMIDTETHACSLLVDGNVMDVTDIYLSKSYYNDEQYLSFEYSVDHKMENGLVEKRRYYLPKKEDVIEKDAYGMAFEDNTETIKKQIQDFFNK